MKKGFTLIELVVVMAIVAVLASIIVGAIVVSRRTASETTHRGNAKTLQTALESYYSRNRSYPAITTGWRQESFKQLALRLGEDTLPSSANRTLTGDAPACKDYLFSATSATYVDGGGYIKWSSNGDGYAIYPVTYNCASALTGSSIIYQPTGI